MVSLARMFVESGGRDVAGAEALLEDAVARGRATWPALAITPDAFVAHLARHVDPESDLATALSALSIEDLYLAFGCVCGDLSAIHAFDKQLLDPAIAYARRVHRREDGIVDEAAQRLRLRLLVREPEREPAIASFAGRSALAAWLRVAAVREARYLLRLRGPASGDDDRLGEGRVGPPSSGSPEEALLKREGGESMKDALEHALASLDERERALLRLYFIEGMPLATLGRIYHVHESTMARRLQTLRARLLDDVKRDLSIGTTSVHDLRALVESQLDVHLSEVLRRPGSGPSSK